MSFLGTLAIVAALMQGAPDSTGTAVALPKGEVVQDPQTGSYYQVFEFYGKPPHTWEHASHMVRGYLYEEREGQLASIKSLDTHYFLLLSFPKLRMVPMWIGLSVQCNESADATWPDGSNLREQNFRAWNEGTAAKISRTCRKEKDTGNIHPVYYQADEFGVRWELGSPKQNITYMLVEFPEPPEEEDRSMETGQPSTE